MTRGRDEGAGGRARSECRVDVDDPGTTRIEADRYVSIRILDFDLPLAVQCERTRPTAKCDSGPMIEESSVGNWNRAEKTGCDWDRHRSW
jgi:hypothetical protein